MKKKGTWKILSKSITGMPMECFEGEKKISALEAYT